MIHASCVAFGKKGVLIFGKSGSGKSDLSLRLIDMGAKLVADDQVILKNYKGHLLATCPKSIIGKIEAYGLGILTLPFRKKVYIHTVVEIKSKVDRMPETEYFTYDGVKVPKIKLPAFEISSPIKIKLFLEKKLKSD